MQLCLASPVEYLPSFHAIARFFLASSRVETGDGRKEGNGIPENEPCLPLPDKLLLLLAAGYGDATLAQRYFGRYTVRVNSDFDAKFALQNNPHNV